MTSSDFSIDQQAEIDHALDRSGQLQDRVTIVLDLEAYDAALVDVPGTDLAFTCASLSMEHADSILTLVARGNPSTATAILRMQFESMVRSAWAMHAATPEEIEFLERDLSEDADVAARKIGVYSTMLKSLRRSVTAPRGLIDELERIDEVLRHGMNSFIHGGFLPIKRHGDGFPVPSVLQVVVTSNAISTMTAALVAGLVADDGRRIGQLNALVFEFRDVMPALTIVPPYNPAHQSGA